MKKYIVLVGCILVLFSVSVSFAYKLVKVQKWGERGQEGTTKYYRFSGADDIANWWKKNVTEITNCDKEPWVFIVDTKREGMVAGAGNHLTYAKNLEQECRDKNRSEKKASRASGSI